MGRIITFLGLSIFLLSASQNGCKRKTTIATGAPATKVRDQAYLKKKLAENDFSAVKSLNAEAKLYTETEGSSLTVSANLIWIRDSVIWMAVKKFGLEAARVLVTKDSVFLLNRIEKTYTAKGLESLQRQYQLPAGFDLIQSALLSQPWYFKDINLESDIKDSLHRLSGANARYSADYRIEEGSFRLVQENFVETKNANYLSISSEEYKNLYETAFFPYLRRINAYGPDAGETNVEIRFSSVEVNVFKPYRFEIPSHYKKVD